MFERGAKLHAILHIVGGSHVVDSTALGKHRCLFVVTLNVNKLQLKREIVYFFALC
jgi:hypothetical protein